MTTLAAAMPASGPVPCARDADILFDLGISYSTGTGGKPVDVVEAHKCFNLAALTGHASAAEARASLAADMTMAQISAAQRAARSWMVGVAPAAI